LRGAVGEAERDVGDFVVGIERGDRECLLSGAQPADVDSDGAARPPVRLAAFPIPDKVAVGEIVRELRDGSIRSVPAGPAAASLTGIIATIVVVSAAAAAAMRCDAVQIGRVGGG